MQLTLYHFFPEKLNLYGDRGNIISLKKRCEWRGIDLQIKEIKSTDGIDLTKADLLFIGGGSDREQSLCTQELFKIKEEFKQAIEDGVPALTICGGYQFLGNYYLAADGEKMEGLGILDFYTESKPGRLIGNVLLESEKFGQLAGFENHGGRTYHSYDTLGSVVKGQGNNGEDGKEGLLYRNLIGTYLHGPILPKNPSISDYLIQAALTRKNKKTSLMPLPDALEKETKKRVWDMFSK